MDINNKKHKASLKISQDVIETIASVAALEIEGVASLEEPQGNLQGFIKNRLVKQKIETAMVNGIAEVSLCINLELGAKVSDVCKLVQQNVKENIQTMTGIIVGKVNITVVGVNTPETVSKEAPEDVVE